MIISLKSVSPDCQFTKFDFWQNSKQSTIKYQVSEESHHQYDCNYEKDHWDYTSASKPAVNSTIFGSLQA